MSTKRRRATSPSSSVSGGGDLDDASSTPGSGRKRRRTSNIPTVDPVHEPHIFSGPRQCYGFRHLVEFIVVLTCWVTNFICLIITCPKSPPRFLYATSCLTPSGTTRMTKEGSFVNSSSGFQREGTFLFYMSETHSHSTFVELHNCLLDSCCA